MSPRNLDVPRWFDVYESAATRNGRALCWRWPYSMPQQPITAPPGGFDGAVRGLLERLRWREGARR